MAGFLARRFGQMLLVIFGVSTLVFFALFIAGDPATLMLPPDATAAEIAAFRHRMGFDAPLLTQYLHYLGKLLHGDFGTSLRFHAPALALVLRHLPATVLLAVTAMGWSTLLGVGLGILAAVRRDRPADTALRLVGLSGQAIPVFWLGLLLILLFSIRLRLLPVGGYGGLRHLVLPALTLGAYAMSTAMRLTRSSLIEALGKDYVRTARAKGMPEPYVVVRHALRNALIPVLTFQALEFASLLGGAVVTETIFSWPGIGRLAIQAIHNRDFPLVQAIVILSALCFTTVNLLVDVAYRWLNPRVRLA
ncbi:ABC transporter permease [Acetobacteraceae bacterium KSS8]|uniref:ABC transporter permease n=1 Tax=Endosaccharibacter trunci TaxID=2812733 RepID=A0ABT1W703_9PROT|nr:ABC transporter permease [Acetobacteraceae bacterium KSS8]